MLILYPNHTVKTDWLKQPIYLLYTIQNVFKMFISFIGDLQYKDVYYTHFEEIDAFMNLTHLGI